MKSNLIDHFTMQNPWGGAPFKLDHDFKLLFEGGESVIIGKISHIYIRRIMALKKYLNITFKYNETLQQTYILKNQKPRTLLQKKYYLSIFTLFKTNNAKEISIFVEYYRNLGVQHFILYLNGRMADYPDILKLAHRYAEEGAPVTFAEWNYDYYLPQTVQHHNAQLTAMHSGLYRSKSWTTWLGYVDTDEFIVITPPYVSLMNRIESLNPQISVILFCNKFAHHLNSTASLEDPKNLMFMRLIVYESTPDW